MLFCGPSNETALADLLGRPAPLEEFSISRSVGLEIAAAFL
jgi:hypothetical protein